MRSHAFLGAILTVALGTAGCQNEKADPTAPRVGSVLMQLAAGTYT